MVLLHQPPKDYKYVPTTKPGHITSITMKKRKEKPLFSEPQQSPIILTMTP